MILSAELQKLPKQMEKNENTDKICNEIRKVLQQFLAIDFFRAGPYNRGHTARVL